MLANPEDEDDEMDGAGGDPGGDEEGDGDEDDRAPRKKSSASQQKLNADREEIASILDAQLREWSLAQVRRNHLLTRPAPVQRTLYSTFLCAPSPIPPFPGCFV